MFGKLPPTTQRNSWGLDDSRKVCPSMFESSRTIWQITQTLPEQLSKRLRIMRVENLVWQDRAEKRLRVRAVDSFWRIFDRLISERLAPWTTLWLWVIPWRLPLLTRWNLTNFENNPIQQEVSDIPNLFRGNVGCLAILKPANLGKRCSTLTAPLGE